MWPSFFALMLVTGMLFWVTIAISFVLGTVEYVRERIHAKQYVLRHEGELTAQREIGDKLIDCAKQFNDANATHNLLTRLGVEIKKHGWVSAKAQHDLWLDDVRRTIPKPVSNHAGTVQSHDTQTPLPA